MLTSYKSSLVIAPAIEKQFLTGTMEMSLANVLTEMMRQRSFCDLREHGEKLFHAPNCLLVEDGGKLCGTFSDADLVRLIAEGEDLGRVSLGDAIQIPSVSLHCAPDEDIFIALDLLRHNKVHHLPIVDEGEKILGVVTYDSLRHALPPMTLLTRLHCVADVMATNLIMATSDTPLLEIAKLMANHHVGCVIICDHSGDRPRPVGIVTEQDIVQFQSLELDFCETFAGEVMSTPLFTLTPEASLWEAHQTMNQQRVRRLVVVDKDDIAVGLVSQTSLFQVLSPSDMYQMIDLLQTVVDERTAELATKNQQLQEEIHERQQAERELQKAHDRLKDAVRERTQQLHEANAQLRQDLECRERMTQELQQALKDLQETQLQLIQTEKMTGLGQLVAGIAHEINNPINFIYGNLQHAGVYIDDILETLSLYERYYPQAPQEIRNHVKKVDLEFLRCDVKELISSMYSGVNRIRNLLMSLRTFSRLDESKCKMADIHQGLDSTLLLIQNRTQGHHHFPKVQVVREYETIPQIECYPGQLNQVFLNLLVNAVDAIEEAQQQSHYADPQELLASVPGDNDDLLNYKKPQIRIETSVSPDGEFLTISIKDNGLGIPEDVQQRLFDPFFTTKPVGKGTGLGLSISYQIVVENHGGKLECHSIPDEGTEFVIVLPVVQMAIAA